MRYDDDTHIINYLNTGMYPKIHDDIFSLHQFTPGKNVLDLGSSIGLLSHRLSNVYSNVVGVEYSEKSIAKAMKKDNIRYYNLKIDLETIPYFEDILRNHNITIIYARRIIPELYETNGYNLIKSLAHMFYSNNIEYIVLEGRKFTSKAKNPVYSIDKEIDLFSDYYYVKHKINNCCVLQRKC